MSNFLSYEEKKLVELYRLLSPDMKSTVFRLVENAKPFREQMKEKFVLINGGKSHE